MSRTEQSDLFGQGPEAAQPAASKSPGGHRPLAARMRPQNLSEVIGQEHILGEQGLLPRLVRTNTFGSLIFYGPPGCGKTSLAEAIAAETNSAFQRINAVLSNVAELRDVLRWARSRPEQLPILFIDEIHRFNKSQQDLLLPDVEAGHIRLIGATTHNPGFYINPPLLSRSHLFRLEPVSEERMAELLEKALNDDDRGLGARDMRAEPEVLRQLARMSDGDLRRALNALETLALSLSQGSELKESDLEAFAKERHIRYDANEDEHYDTASAFIKSMRGSDPDAALYWLGKMLKGGEDPRFIARRLVIFASEDVGLADPRALPLAVATFQACDLVGLPECQLNLAHCVTFLATTVKSNSTTEAIGRVFKSIERDGLQGIPLWLRDAHTKTNKSLGHGDGYLYSHEFPEGVSGQDYMTEPKSFYQPKSSGAEERIRERLKHLKELKKKAKNRQTPPKSQ
ncbi:MAG: replication-associated recombination protein A [Opitutales bacterium]|nr:replication-associated recombination protein A [Opitutales bacterium]